MERHELIGRLVLDEICDEYENVDQCILPELVRDGARLGLSIDRPEICATLARLIGEGLAKAYLLSDVTTELEVMPPLDVVEENFKTYRSTTKIEPLTLRSPSRRRT